MLIAFAKEGRQMKHDLRAQRTVSRGDDGRTCAYGNAALEADKVIIDMQAVGQRIQERTAFKLDLAEPVEGNYKYVDR